MGVCCSNRSTVEVKSSKRLDNSQFDQNPDNSRIMEKLQISKNSQLLNKSKDIIEINRANLSNVQGLPRQSNQSNFIEVHSMIKEMKNSNLDNKSKLDNFDCLNSKTKSIKNNTVQATFYNHELTLVDKTPFIDNEDEKNVNAPIAALDEKKEISGKFISSQEISVKDKASSKSVKNFFKTISIKHKNQDFDIKPKIEEKKGKQVKEFYDVICKLGTGSFGTVFKVKNKETGIIRAMKIIDREAVYLQDDEQKFLKEIEILRTCEHMNIIKIYEYFEDKKRFYLITEYVHGQELYDAICQWEHIDERIVRKIFYQIMSAITYLHKNNILHRDMKPENILIENKSKKLTPYTGIDLLSEFNIKVIDFGTSNYFKKNKKLNLIIGSPYYIAPEVLDGEYNEKCDIWSCGCILYVLLVGYPPFDAENRDALSKKIKSGKIDLKGDGWENISPKAKDLVKDMLERKYSKRLSAEEVMNHPWMVAENSEFSLVGEKKLNALNNMKNFYKQDKLQQATIAYITYFLTPSEEIVEMKKLFKALDKNGDGTLSPQEIMAGFTELFGAAVDGLDLKEVLYEMDGNGDGVITYEEFLRVVVNKNTLLNEQNLKICFESFDTNGDGKLSAEEIKKALGAKDNDYVKNLIGLIDENGNNEIDFDEFKTLMEVVLRRENGEEDELEVDNNNI